MLKLCRDCRYHKYWITVRTHACCINLLGETPGYFEEPPVSIFDARKLTGHCGPTAILFEPMTAKERADKEASA